MKLILRTSVRNCRRCGCASRNVELFHQPSADESKMTPYREPFLPAATRLEDIERRTDCHPIAVCPSCIDGFSAKPKGKVVHMNGEDYEGPSVPRNHFVLRPPAAKPIPAKETKKPRPRPSASKTQFDLNSFIASL